MKKNCTYDFHISYADLPHTFEVIIINMLHLLFKGSIYGNLYSTVTPTH